MHMKLSTLAIAVALAATAITTVANDATAQTRFGLTYDAVPSLQNAAGSIDGIALDVERPLFGAVNAALVVSPTRATLGAGLISRSASRTFVGVGPRMRIGAERASGFAHALVGALRSNVGAGGGRFNLGVSETEFNSRLGGGVDYRVGTTWALRLGGDYDAELHLLVGLSRGL